MNLNFEYLSTKSPHTQRAVKHVVEDYAEFTGGSVSPEAIQLYINSLVNKNSASTIKQRFSLLKSHFKFNGIHIDKGRISLPKSNPRRRTALDKHLMEKYVKVVEKTTRSKKLKAILLLLPLTGLRISELCGDPAHGTDGIKHENLLRTGAGYFLRVVGKGNKERLVPLNETAKEILLGYLRESKEPAPFKVHHDVIREKLNAIKKKLGIEQLTPHTMRHTFISELIRKGVDIKTVQEIVGHSSPVTTLGYVHTTLPQMKSAVEKLFKEDDNAMV